MVMSNEILKKNITIFYIKIPLSRGNFLNLDRHLRGYLKNILISSSKSTVARPHLRGNPLFFSNLWIWLSTAKPRPRRMRSPSAAVRLGQPNPYIREKGKLQEKSQKRHYRHKMSFRWFP